MSKILCRCICGIILFPLCLLASTPECVESPEFYRYLSGSIEAETGGPPVVKLFPCDTVIVARGVTLTIGKNARLAFADSKEENAILVEGTLIVLGDTAQPVHIGSEYDSTTGSYRGEWKGISVAPTGKLILESAVVHHAETPLSIRSQDVQVEGSKFIGGKSFLLPDGEEFHLPASFLVESFNAKTPPPVELAMEPPIPPGPAPNSKEKEERKPFYKRAGFYLLGTAAISAAVAGSVFALKSREPKVKEVSLGTVEL